MSAGTEALAALRGGAWGQPHLRRKTDATVPKARCQLRLRPGAVVCRVFAATTGLAPGARGVVAANDAANHGTRLAIDEDTAIRKRVR